MARARNITRILILGGTTEARQLSERLAQRKECEVTLSLAGRTENPVPHPVPVRTGGFGGADGLARYLTETGTDVLVDATHPFAARISANAAEAAQIAGIELLALRRPPWLAADGDRWHEMPDVSAAAETLLHRRPSNIFLALGRQELLPFEAVPQHRYLVRSVDPVEPPLALPDVSYIVARGPFPEADEFDFLSQNRIDVIVCKNSGGAATYGKLAAARRLGIEVLMIERPTLPQARSAATVEEAVGVIDHLARSTKKRGV